MKEQSNNSIIRDLTNGSVPKQLLRFASPLFLSGLLQVVYNLVDMMVVGRIMGKNGLAAVSLGGEVLMFLTFVSTGFANAGQVVISQYIGAGLRERLNRLIGTLFSFLLGSAAVLSFVCYLLREKILLWVNTPASAYTDAMAYLVPCILGLVFVYGYNLVSAILRGMGDSRHPFLFIAIASVLNLVLDLLFVAVFRWGTMGAALATVTGQGVSFLLALGFLYRKRKDFCFDFRPESFIPHPETLATLLRLGIPMVLQSAAITFSKLFITAHINVYGVEATSVSGIGNKLMAFTNVFAQALSTAGSSMIAQCIGAERYERVPKVIRTSFLFDACVASVLSAVTVLWPKAVFGLFTSDETVLELALVFVPVAVLHYLGCVFRPPMMALINGSGNSRLNLAIGLLDGLMVRIGLAFFMGKTLGLGIYGFWYGNAISGFMPFFIGLPYYLSGRWRTRKYLLKKLQQ